MSVDFPSTPAVGQLFDSGTRRYRATAANVWTSDDLTAMTRNRLVNGAMLMSQESGDGAAGSVWTPGGSGWPADQWVGTWNYAAGAAMITHSYGAPFGEGGDAHPWPCRACVIYTNAARGLTSTAYAHIYQYIEGQRIADFKFGTPNALPIVLRFSCMTVAPGDYTFAIHNHDSTRSFYRTFTMNAVDTWQEFVFAIPGDTGGTWKTDNTAGMLVALNAAFEYAYMGGTPGIWNAGTYYTDHVFNFAGARDGYFRISKVGLYLDPFGTGVAPAWVHPNYADEEKLAMRYWYKSRSHRGVWTGASSVGRASVQHPVIMRANPAAGIRGALQMYDGYTGGALASISSNYSNSHMSEIDCSSNNGGHGASRCCTIYTGTLDSDYIAMDARI